MLAQQSGSDPAVEAIDRVFHAALARITGGLSPAALALAFADWRCIFWPRPESRPVLSVGRSRTHLILSTPWCRGMQGSSLGP
ncbi:poly-beta-hydroxybutyrate polymerase N-terminal domain-containing protein (plasmid) [Bradyrhizobium sp. CCGUVB23]|nr:poly-beta-hydroxybutyrate polymerase N-terminal domain-containing protein [Bradyrhizobium sp. CCGUVB23]MCP3468030.1 poly-beta-hydroxybutyrate polymerase N-terminal domain-containing protein [Bradyrhizobium sp. CCGUVB23]